MNFKNNSILLRKIPTDENVIKFVKFLKDHEVTEKGAQCTHTTLGTTFGLPWGKFYINDYDLEVFLNLYKRVLLLYLKSDIKESPLHIIERPKHVGPILVDLDFRQDNKERSYSIKTIKYIINKYNNFIKKYVKASDNSIEAFVFEKEKPSYDIKKNNYKDGFHIIYPKITVDASLRYKILEEIQKIVVEENGLNDIDYINSDDEVFDKSIVMHNGLTMYGSRKDGCQMYKLTHIFNSKLQEQRVNQYSPDELVILLSLRVHDQDEPLPLREGYDTDDFKCELKKIYDRYHSKNKKKRNDTIKEETSSQGKEEKIVENRNNNCKVYAKSNNDVQVARRLTALLSKDRASKYNSWIHVGWALHNIDDNLLDCFITFSKRCPKKYEEGCCEDVWERARDNGFTLASLYWWAKEDNPAGYVELLRENVKTIISEAECGSHDDIAKVVYELYKHYYKCASIKKNIWYEFQQHRWVMIDSGYTLANKISDEVTNEFAKLASQYFAESIEKKGLEKDHLMTKANQVCKIVEKLKNEPFKNSLLNACARRFIDSNFEQKLDENPFLIGFNNGVYDLKNRCFRNGVPDDYITLSVGYDYKEYSKDDPTIKEIESFFYKVQREDDMRKYILTLISSYLVGTNKDQKFILWTGIGCHAPGTKIMMNDGTVKEVEKIKTGEMLMGNDGTPRRVMQLFSGQDDMYEIKPYKGDPYVVNKEHRLVLKYIGYNPISYIKSDKAYMVTWYEFHETKMFTFKRKTFRGNKGDEDLYKRVCLFRDENAKNNANFVPGGHIITIKVRDLLKLPYGLRRLFNGFKCSVEFQQEPLDVDPYILGYWIGDGHTDASKITTADPEIVECFKKFADNDDLMIRGANKYTYGITTGTLFDGAGRNQFTNFLREYDLFGNKHIPHNYMCNSRENRLRLLAGIVDSGACNNDKPSSNNFEICFKSEKLIDDVIHLARSLGYSAYKYKCYKTCNNASGEPKTKEYFRTQIYGDHREEIPTILKRKIARGTINKRDSNSTSIKINYVGKGEYYGFELDGNGSYLIHDFTVMKNSNGKSTTIDLIRYTFGDYFGVLPITILTKKRAGSGNATPELADKRGKRFLAIQEPEHDDTIYVGLMKELTGSDWVVARALYGDPFMYKPQFKLVLTCNKLPNIPSTDGGTWRRLRVSPWESEFVDEPKLPNQHAKDPELGEKLKTWNQGFMWLLLNVYYPYYCNNELKEPKKVTQFTDKYKKDTDIYWEYIYENIDITKNNEDSESLMNMYNSFRNWYCEAYANTKMGSSCPARKVFTNYLNDSAYKVENGKVYGVKFKAGEISI